MLKTQRSGDIACGAFLALLGLAAAWASTTIGEGARDHLHPRNFPLSWEHCCSSAARCSLFTLIARAGADKPIGWPDRRGWKFWVIALAALVLNVGAPFAGVSHLHLFSSSRGSSGTLAGTVPWWHGMGVGVAPMFSRFHLVVGADPAHGAARVSFINRARPAVMGMPGFRQERCDEWKRGLPCPADLRRPSAPTTCSSRSSAAYRHPGRRAPRYRPHFGDRHPAAPHHRPAGPGHHHDGRHLLRGHVRGLHHRHRGEHPG